VLDAVALLDFQFLSFFFHCSARPEPEQCLYTIRVQSLGGTALAVLVFVEQYDYITLRSASSVFIVNVCTET
jgi:hypothetical protein